MTGPTASLRRALRRRGLLTALVTAAGILVLLVAQTTLVSVFGSLSYPEQQLTVSGERVAAGAAHGLLAAAPLAVGALVSFWQLAPIAGGLRLAHVVTRSLLSLLVGGVALWATHAVARVTGSDGAGGWEPHDLVLLIFDTLVTLTQAAPVLVLGAILSWGWQQTHPLREQPAGALDEV